ncbi:DNA-directed RNA polymerase subunit delta [Paenibacillus hunanensis]|uniref:DNA-directed RNA polymerase subunit delta n=1 Tax=Paenibacillus hunanensis TaxID=539262 RepID=UPI002A6A6097|nr:DNA-directed RNA polymerase subunit delta [Paenibacillus hunanensis]WPP41485.1 DNA-directed RNA polymerase subunit delta [Paenibacillus hunanensis]
MSTPQELKINPDKVHEIPMVDLAFAVLKKMNTPLYYRDLMKEVAELRGYTEEQVNEYIAQLYTELNIDGRFACVGTNLWGLKRWYPLERAEDPIANAKRPRIINDDNDDDDIEDDEFNNDDTPEDLDEDDEIEEDNYDDVDENDDDDIYNDEESEELVIEDEEEDDDFEEEEETEYNEEDNEEEK